MKKSCCVEKASVCAGSSCSMILRSSCSHPPTLTVEERMIRESTPKERRKVLELKHVCPNSEFDRSLEVESILKSNFKEVIQKSDENSCLTKENFFEISEERNFKFYEASLLNSTCVKKLQYDGTSSNSYVNGSFSDTDKCKSYSCGAERNTISNTISSNSSSRMVRTSNRSSTPARALSDSESEELSEGNSVNISLSNLRRRENSYPMGPMRLRSGLTIPEHQPNGSRISQIRWNIWRYIYSFIIKNISFEVWCASRLQEFGKKKTIFILFLFLLLLILFGPQTCKPDIEFSSSTLSFLWPFRTTSFASSLKCDSESNEIPSLDQESNFKLTSALYGLYNFFLASFSHDSLADESASDNSASDNSASFKSASINSASVQEENYLLAAQLKKEILELNQKYDQLIRKSKEMEKLYSDSDANFHTNLNSLDSKLKDITLKLKSLDGLKKCCDEKWNPDQVVSAVETSIATALKEIIDCKSEGSSSQYQFFCDWLDSKFVNQENLAKEINLSLQDFKSKHPINTKNDVKIMMEHINSYLESLKANLSSAASTVQVNSIDDEKILKVVNRAISVYDADKTGKADYALESGGGSVIGTRCSETFVEKSGKVSIFGVPLWSHTNTPRTVIQPSMQPGECWAFKGSQGFLVLELSSTIYPSGFTLEHIPVTLSPVGTIDSAPKDFSVWGLSSEMDNIGLLLGKYTYNIEGNPLQYFPIQNRKDEPFQYVELKVHSNHGNLEYTCLYRFRVHGSRTR